MLINLVGVLLLIVTLVVGTKVTNDRSMSLNISEKASDCFNECRQDSGRERCNERCGVNVNWKGENVIDTSKLDKNADPKAPTCDANGVQYSPGAVVMYGGIGSNATCGQDGKWDVGVGATTDIKPENVPEYAKESDKLKKQIEDEKQAAEQLATEQQAVTPQTTITTSTAEQENLNREKSQCLQEGGSWFANICSYAQQQQAVATFAPIISNQLETAELQHIQAVNDTETKTQAVIQTQPTTNTQITNPFANITAGVSSGTKSQRYVPPLLPTVPTVEDLINKIPGLEKLNTNDVKNFNYPTSIQEENKTTLLGNLASLSTQFSNALSGSKLEGLGTYGLGGGNAYVAPVPQNIIKSQNNSDLYNYMLGNTISAGAGFASATLVTPGAPMFVFETATSIPGALRLLTAADIADNIVTGGACALGNQESCSYFQSTLFIPAPTGVGNMLVDSIEDFSKAWGNPISSLDNLSFAGSVLRLDDPNLGAWPDVNSNIVPDTNRFFATNTNELSLIADLEIKPKPIDMLFAPALDNLPNTPAKVIMDDLSRPLPDAQISNPVTTVQDIWRQNIISSDGIILPKLNKSPNIDPVAVAREEISLDYQGTMNRFEESSLYKAKSASHKPQTNLETNFYQDIGKLETVNNPLSFDEAIKSDQYKTNPVLDELIRANSIDEIKDILAKNDIPLIKTKPGELPENVSALAFFGIEIHIKPNILESELSMLKPTIVHEAGHILKGDEITNVFDKLKGEDPNNFMNLIQIKNDISVEDYTYVYEARAALQELDNNPNLTSVERQKLQEMVTNAMKQYNWVVFGDVLPNRNTLSPSDGFLPNVKKWWNDEAAKLNPNALDNINEDFSNFWQNNVYSQTDGFLPKWTDVNDNPIINRIIGSPEDINLRPNEIANPLPTVDNAPTTPLTTKVGDWWDNIINPKFDTTSPTTQEIIKELEAVSASDNVIKGDASIDVYLKEYGNPEYVFKSKSDATKLYNFQSDILRIKSANDFQKIFDKTISNLKKNGVEVIVYDRLYDFIDKVGNGHLDGTLGTSEPILFSNGKKSSKVSIASPELLKQIYKIYGDDISLDTAKMITLQKIGHEGGHSLDWIKGLMNGDLWLTEIRQKNFNLQFYEHIGSEGEARHYRGFLEDFRKRFGGP